MNEPITIFKASAVHADCQAVKAHFEANSREEWNSGSGHARIVRQIKSPYSIVEIRTDRKDVSEHWKPYQVMVWNKWYYMLQTPNDALARLSQKCRLVIQGKQSTHHFNAIYNGCDGYVLEEYITPDQQTTTLHPRMNPIPPDVLEDIDAGFMP